MSHSYDGEVRLGELVRHIVMALVDDEDAVKVETLCETMHTNLTVRTAPNDFGKVLGRQGQTIEAIRLIVNAVGSKFRLPTCTLFVEDPNPDRKGKFANWRRR